MLRPMLIKLVERLRSQKTGHRSGNQPGALSSADSAGAVVLIPPDNPLSTGSASIEEKVVSPKLTGAGSRGL